MSNDEKDKKFDNKITRRSPYHSFTDEELIIKSANENDMGAFEEIYWRYAQKIYNFSLRYLGNRMEAEDTVQEVFMRVYSNRARYQPKAKFSAWIFRIARNLCVDKSRKYWRRKVTPESQMVEEEESTANNNTLTNLAVTEETSRDNIERSELEQQVKSAIDSLPKRQREIIILHRYQGLSYKDIGDILKMSPESVKQCAYRAHQKLRQKLSKILEV